MVIGIVVGWIKKGSIINLSRIRVKMLWILPLAYLCQAISIHTLDPVLYVVLITASYLALICFCVRNRSIYGVKWAGTGILLNFIEMALNGLRMPAYVPSVRSVGPSSVALLKSGHAGKSVAMNSHTLLPFLGDIIPIRLYPPSVVSIGDCLFSLGLVLLIVGLMTSENGVESDAQFS